MHKLFRTRVQLQLSVQELGGWLVADGEEQPRQGQVRHLARLDVADLAVGDRKGFVCWRLVIWLNTRVGKVLQGCGRSATLSSRAPEPRISLSPEYLPAVCLKHRYARSARMSHFYNAHAARQRRRCKGSPHRARQLPLPSPAQPAKDLSMHPRARPSLLRPRVALIGPAGPLLSFGAALTPRSG